MSRIAKRFADLKAAGRKGFVAYISAGDPDLETSFEILKGLPGAGVDVIELGVPFTDPAADGPSVQAAGQRALKAGSSMRKVLDMVRRFREQDSETPIVLMGYFNPISAYGVDRFLTDAKAAGVDGLIVVDLPPEEDDELCIPAVKAGIHFIRLATPTTDAARLPAVLQNTSGFLYYVSVAGTTGAAAADPVAVGKSVAMIKQHTKIPVAVGFGIRDGQRAAAIAGVADAAVVGTALVERVTEAQMKKIDPAEHVLELVRELSAAVRGVAKSAA